jgi:hypothetical protein
MMTTMTLISQFTECFPQLSVQDLGEDCGVGVVTNGAAEGIVPEADLSHLAEEAVVVEAVVVPQEVAEGEAAAVRQEAEAEVEEVDLQEVVEAEEAAAGAEEEEEEEEAAAEEEVVVVVVQLLSITKHTQKLLAAMISWSFDSKAKAQFTD